MLLKVLKPFIDKHTKETYEVGQEIEVTEKRGFEIIYSPILGPSFVEPILDNEKDQEAITQDTIIHHDGEEEVINYPQHVGGGQYLLSDGTKVKGEDAAIKAEKELIGE